MLLKAAQIFQSVTPIMCQASGGSYTIPKASYHTSVSKIDTKLLYPFNQEKTLRALDVIQEKTANSSIYKPDSKNLILLDKLSQTVSSETYRVFDTTLKKFFAVKTLNLDSNNAWKQLNLSLRRHEKDHPILADFTYLNYDSAGKEVKIVTEIQPNILGGGLASKLWSTEELKTIMLNLLNQMNSMKELGAHCHYIKPEHIFASELGNALKLYDFSGFEVEPDSMKWKFSPSLNVDAAVFSLVRIIDPHSVVNHPEEARSYLQRRYPEFAMELNEIESRSWSFGSWYKAKTLEGMNSNSNPTAFHSKEYDRRTLTTIKEALETKNLANFNESWGSVNQGLKNHNEAANSFQRALDENISRYGYAHENTCRSYLNLAETYKSMGQVPTALDYFRKAVNASYSVSNMDGITMARLYNEYGKLLKSQGQYTDSLDCFKKAEKAMQDSPSKHPALAAEIQSNLSSVYRSSDSTENFFDEFAKLWKKSVNYDSQEWEAFFKKYNFYPHRRFFHKMEKFGRKMENFGGRMEDFARRMEKMGSQYKDYDWANHYKQHGWNSHNHWWNSKSHENVNETQKNGQSESHQQNHQWSCFRQRSGWPFNHHRNPYHNYSYYNYSSYYRPEKCGFFSRFARFMKKLIWYTFLMVVTVKIWRKFTRPPQDKNDSDDCHGWRFNHHHFHYESSKGTENQPKDNNDPSQKTDEKKDYWSHHWGRWHRSHHRESSAPPQESENQPKDNQNSYLFYRESERKEDHSSHWGRWHHHHHHHFPRDSSAPPQDRTSQLNCQQNTRDVPQSAASVTTAVVQEIQEPRVMNLQPAETKSERKGFESAQENPRTAQVPREEQPKTVKREELREVIEERPKPNPRRDRFAPAGISNKNSERTSRGQDAPVEIQPAHSEEKSSPNNWLVFSFFALLSTIGLSA